MGLDMYLTKETYVQNWDHMKDSEKHEIIITGPRASSIKPERITYITEQLVYWRKANAIHAWFVDNVFDGDQDRAEGEVSRDELKTLLDTVEMVLKGSKLIKGDVHMGTQFSKGVKTELYEEGTMIQNTELAAELLPSKEGFFFGGTDYDQFYLEDLRHTAKELRRILNEETTEYFSYRASW